MIASTSAVAAHLNGLDDPLFVVVDGAFFDDVVADAHEKGFKARPLYTDEGTSRVGPHLIAVNGSQALEDVVTLVGDRPTGIIWSWQGDGDSLWRHLRKNSMMEIPLTSENAYETVLFRYADANVIASLLKLLDERQYARFVGDASRLVLRATEPPEVHVFPAAVRSYPNPLQSRFIRLSGAQLATLSNNCMERSRLRVMRALRRGVPDETSIYSDAKMLEIIVASERQGYEIGIRSERAHARWAYLNLITKGRLLEQPGVLEYMKDG